MTARFVSKTQLVYDREGKEIGRVVTKVGDDYVLLVVPKEIEQQVLRLMGEADKARRTA